MESLKQMPIELKTALLSALGFMTTVASSTENVEPIARLGVTALLTAAVSVQYWENRKKDKEINEMQRQQAVQNEKIINLLDDIRDELRGK